MAVPGGAMDIAGSSGLKDCRKIFMPVRTVLMSALMKDAWRKWRIEL